MHAWYVRVIALVIIAALSVGSRSSVLAIGLCVAASIGSYLLWANERHLRRGTKPRFWLSQVYLRNVIKTDGVHRLSLGSYFEIPEACVLIAIPAWIATDDPLLARLIMLAAATVVPDHDVIADLQRPHLVQSRRSGPSGLARDLPAAGGADHRAASLSDRAASRLGTERLACGASHLADATRGGGITNLRYRPDHEDAARPGPRRSRTPGVNW